MHQPGPALDPALEVLRRPDGSVQLGWGPDTAAVLSPGAGLDAFALSTVLSLLDGRSSRAEILARTAQAGLADDAVTVLLDELTTVGAVRDPGGTVPVAPRVRVHGRGPLADTLVTQLTVSGTRLSRSAAYTGDSDVARWDVQCVLLADALVPDPRLVRELMRHRVPHLTVLLRDGRGIVGPFVVPGRTSCLRCADLTRTDLDPHWPQLAAQLCDRVGCAEPPRGAGDRGSRPRRARRDSHDRGARDTGPDPRGGPAQSPARVAALVPAPGLRVRRPAGVTRGRPTAPRAGGTASGMMVGVAEIPRRSSSRTAKLASIPPRDRRSCRGGVRPASGRRGPRGDRRRARGEGCRTAVHGAR